MAERVALLGRRLEEAACQGRQEAHLGASSALEELELEESVQEELRMSEVWQHIRHSGSYQLVQAQGSRGRP